MVRAAVPADSCWVGTPLIKLPCHTTPLPPRLRLAPAPPDTLRVEPAAALNRPPACRLTADELEPERCTRLPLRRLRAPALSTLRAPLALRPA